MLRGCIRDGGLAWTEGGEGRRYKGGGYRGVVR